MILANRVKCLECGKVIQSKHTHDYQICGCDNQTFVDGGLSYQIYGGVDMSMIESLMVTSEFPHWKIRETMLWGNNYDKDKKLLPETKWMLVKDLDDGHLDALIELMDGREINQVFINEKKYRDERTTSK